MGIIGQGYDEYDIVPSHELDHLYGGKHGTNDDPSDHSWMYDRYGDNSYTKSVMSVPGISGVEDCHGGDNPMPFGTWYSGCTVIEAHDCMDGGGNCNI